MTAATTAWLALVVTGLVAVAIDITLALRRPDNRLRTALVGSRAQGHPRSPCRPTRR